jgi:DNA ligase 1
LLKMKAWYDTEAVVIGYQPGKGKHAGRVGALRIRTANGVEFLLGTGLSDTERDNPPPIGSRVTFRYRSLTPRGLPRFASFYRTRDL